MMKILCIFAVVGASLGYDNGEIKNLIGEPDYRKVRLNWESNKTDFQVRYCELQSWGPQRCRSQEVDESEDNAIDNEEDFRSYTANIMGLRMATTYSFEIRPVKQTGEREDRADGDDKNQNIIVIPTKGFSARATQCLPHASVIEVSTGPYFGGRIAVEAADGERCALDGEPTSPRDTYTLRINHTECGSQVNSTTVATFVLVQENLPILTHSTRRFLVLCSYQPETLTVRAGINLPTGHSGRGSAQNAAVPSEDENNSFRRSRHLRPARLLQAPEPMAAKQQEFKADARNNTAALPIALIGILMITGTVCIIGLILKWTSKKLAPELDNISIASNTTTSSTSMASDVESGAESLPHVERVG